MVSVDGWTHLATDLLTGIAFFVISISLITALRRGRQLAFSRSLTILAALLAACGTAQAVAVVLPWHATNEESVSVLIALCAVAVTLVLLHLLRHLSYASDPHAFGANGRPLDISALRHAELDLRHSLERSHRAERMEAIGQLTGGIAHDFNNLLAVVVHNLDMLEEDAGAGSQAQAMLSQARAAALHGAALTSQLLAFARKLPLEPRNVDLASMSHDVVELLTGALGDSIQVSFAAAGDLWPVRADPSQLENALLNLAINARDAMPNGGRLSLQGVNVTLRAKDIADLPDAAVGDDGIGMSPEVRARAFEPFFTTKEDGRGTGLGLSMVYGFTRQSGGHVRIESHPGSGTVIKLYLPRSREVVAAPVQLGNAAASSERGDETVLLVDDNKAVSLSTMRVLRSLGYQVMTADDGAEALEILRTEAKVDLLFTDVVMPGGIGGVELVSEAISLRPNLAVLFASGYSNEREIVPLNISTKYRLLGKPYRRRDLAQRIRAALDEVQVA